MVWRIGPVPTASPLTGTATPYLNALGDTAVDFDIAPARAVSNIAGGSSGTAVDASALRTTDTSFNCDATSRANDVKHGSSNASVGSR